MTRKVLLDFEGDSPTPSNIQVVESEVEFLRLATSHQDILIRGERLCFWAEAFYISRGQPVQHSISPLTSLRRVFPSLSIVQAKELAEKINIDVFSIEGITPISVLSHCYPNDYALWQGSPSPRHAAQWLIWFAEHQPSNVETIILRALSLRFVQQSGESPETDLYRAVTPDEAKLQIYRWLGADEPIIQDIGEFPLELPSTLLEEVKHKWMKHIIEQEGSFFADMLRIPIPLVLRQELASLTVKFYKENPHYLTREVQRDLQRYIQSKDISALDDRLPLPQPSRLPETEADVLEWFQTEYLPYRRWQFRFGDDGARNLAVQHAQSFARWVLQHYPKWLLGEGWLVFQKSAQLPKMAEKSLILCVILDGLPAWDAEDMEKSIASRVGRLTLQEKNYCFTSIPTITQFAKDALLHGVPPRLVSQAKPVGEILPDSLSPKNGLRNIRLGSVVFWRVEQPDKAYHFESSDKRERRVKAELDSIVQAIQDVVENLPDDIPLQIIVTSDHGRLLNPKSPRQLIIPEQAEVHGRAAWGDFGALFDETGILINEQTGWVDISGQRFEIEHDARLSWGEESFRLHKGGNEPYPHGGIFPEEIIVPWFLFVRDANPPDIDIILTGAGEAEMSGELIVSMINNSQQRLECLGISLSHGVIDKHTRVVNPLAETKWKISILPWPTKQDSENLSATLLFRQPNGKTFYRDVTLDIEVRSLYERTDDILKDLDL